MKASYRWIRSLVPGLTASPAELAARFTAGGLEVESVVEYGAASRECVVAKVVSERPHPSKSGLKLVTVDRGAALPTIEVVCGAPNVPPAGGLAVLAPLGARLPAKNVTIERRAIGGVTSEGMLCSESELGLSDDGKGILVLEPGAATPGAILADAIAATHDFVFEINLTPNRPDGLGHLGLAREAAALYALPWEPPTVPPPARSPLYEAATLDRLTSIAIVDTERCSRYAAAGLTGVVVRPSPAWVRYRLASLGQRPISNVVDVTNLVLLEYGHPMHAFDLDRLRGDGPGGERAALSVRRAREGETITTLDGVARTLTGDDLVIADGGGAVALAGVMGGASSEIGPGTQRVLLECATFEPRGVRRTSRRHALHTDASHRFERGVDPLDAPHVLARAVALLVETADGVPVAGSFEVTSGALSRTVASLRSSRLDALLGVAVPFDEALAILERLGCRVRARGPNQAELVVPPHRPDITREVDLIEEVARVRGMDAIPTALPKVRPTREDAPREHITRRARRAGVELGLSEALTYSFVSRAALEHVGAPSPAVVLKNPLSNEQEVMRTSLLPGLLTAVSRAERHGVKDARLFTVGAIFLGGRGPDRLPEERLVLSAVLAGERPAYLSKPQEVDAWDAKGLAEGLVERLCPGAAVTVGRFAAQDTPAYLHPRGAASVLLDGSPVGQMGPLHPDVAARLDLGVSALVVVELDLSLLAARPARRVRYAPIPRFPPSTRDLAVVVRESTAAGEVLDAVREAAGTLAGEVTLFDRFVGGKIPDGHQSLAFHIVYRADDRTLTDREVDAEHEKAVALVRQRFGATLRE